jgi:hypothetical protein
MVILPGCLCCTPPTPCSSCNDLLGWVTSTTSPPGIPNIGPSYQQYFNASLPGDVRYLSIISSTPSVFYDFAFFFAEGEWRESQTTVRAQTTVVRTLPLGGCVSNVPVFSHINKSGVFQIFIRCLNIAGAGLSIAIAAQYSKSRNSSTNMVGDTRSSDDKAQCLNSPCECQPYSGTFCKGEFVEVYRLSVNTANDGEYVPLYSDATGDCLPPFQGASSRTVMLPQSPITISSSSSGISVSSGGSERLLPWLLFSTTNTAEEIVLTNHTSCQIPNTWAPADVTLPRWQYTPPLWPSFTFTK